MVHIFADQNSTSVRGERDECPRSPAVAPRTPSSDDQLLRLNQIIGPQGILPFSRSTFYEKVRQGEIAGFQLGKRITVYRRSDILSFIAKMEAGNE